MYSFSISGENLTELVRDMWRSFLPFNAMEALGSLAKEEKLNILTGVKKIVGDSRESAEMSVVMDDEVDLELPTAIEVLEALKQKMADNIAGNVVDLKLMRNLLYLIDVLELDLTTESANIEKLIESDLKKYEEEEEDDLPALSARSRRIIDELEMEDVEWDDKELIKTLPTQLIQTLQLTHQSVRSMTLQHKSRQRQLENTYAIFKPHDITNSEWDSGWINQAGTFYGCPDMTHLSYSEELLNELADRGEIDLPPDVIDASRYFELDGWVKMSCGRFYWDSSHTPTVLQWSAIAKWMQCPNNEKSIMRERVFVNTGYMTLEEISSNAS